MGGRNFHNQPNVSAARIRPNLQTASNPNNVLCTNICLFDEFSFLSGFCMWLCSLFEFDLIYVLKLAYVNYNRQDWTRNSTKTTNVPLRTEYSRAAQYFVWPHCTTACVERIFRPNNTPGSCENLFSSNGYAVGLRTWANSCQQDK